MGNDYCPGQDDSDGRHGGLGLRGSLRGIGLHAN